MPDLCDNSISPTKQNDLKFSCLSIDIRERYRKLIIIPCRIAFDVDIKIGHECKINIANIIKIRISRRFFRVRSVT
jgi:hypothetical protein